jgi:hypothetical protein
MPFPLVESSMQSKDWKYISKFKKASFDSTGDTSGLTLFPLN